MSDPRANVLVIASAARCKEVPAHWTCQADGTQVYQRIPVPGPPAGPALAEVASAALADLSTWMRIARPYEAGEREAPDRSTAYRVDVVWAVADDQPGRGWVQRVLGMLEQAAREVVVPPALSIDDLDRGAMPSSHDADPWGASDLRWPWSWFEVEDHEHVVVSCTRGALAPVRFWFISTTAPYAPPAPGHSLSSVLERDDLTDLRGALATYVEYLARDRRHRLAVLEFEGLASGAARGTLEPTTVGARIDPRPTIEVVTAHAGYVAQARAALANQRVNLSNVESSLDRVGRRLTQLDDDTPHRRGVGPWSFDADDRARVREGTLSAEGALARMEADHDQLRANLAHRDSRDAQRATRSNTVATSFLAIVAGALSAGQLPSGSEHRALMTAGAALGLLGVSLLLFGAWAQRTQVQAALIIGSIGAAGGLLIQLVDGTGVVARTVAAVLVGALVGWVACASRLHRSTDEDGRPIG